MQRSVHFRPSGLSHHGDDQPVGVEQALGLRLHLVQGHRFDHGIALKHIVDAEVLLLQAEKLAGNRRLLEKRSA